MLFITRFPLGRLVITRNAAQYLKEKAIDPSELVQRHALRDWGDLSEEDWAANDIALENGGRIVSAYRFDGAGASSDEKIWIITEADRSLTTILLPEDY